jgi:hypothetical protein
MSKSLIIGAAVVLVVMVGLGIAFPRKMGDYEYIAVWLEGIALVAIFFWDRIDGDEQHRETIEQIKVSQEQVKAAMLSAQAAINTERPWLVVTWASDANTGGLFKFGCRNQGNTPAKVISVSARVRFVNRIADLETPPDYSGHPVAAPDLNILVHQDSFPIAHGVNPGVYVQASGKADAVNNSNEFFVYYGNVVYRDTLNPESSSEGLHQTTWCFVYQPQAERKFIRGGPEEYNRYT